MHPTQLRLSPRPPARLRGYDANAALADEEHMATLVNFIQYPFGDVRSTDEMIGMLTATFAPAPLTVRLPAGS